MSAESHNLLKRLRAVASSGENRSRRAEQIADALRAHGNYRWVGLYDVSESTVSIISWSGASSGQAAPAFPTFPISKGLTSAAIRDRQPVVVGDVRNDPRYLTAFGSTLSEIILPVLNPHTGAVLGTIDVESDRANAFTPQDQSFLKTCAAAAIALWTDNP